jgi:hypothetical protein
MFHVVKVVATCGLAMVLCGCGGGGGPKLARAGGVVTYQGEPLEGASVIFTPQEGPVATGTTDAQGRFQLNTHGEPGAVVDTHSVSISAYEPVNPDAVSTDPDTEGEVVGEMKSRIPEKYGNPTSSGLSAIVSENAASNDFSFDLTN